jgi:hypothetical protein
MDIGDKLKENYDIEDLWVSYEFHPETPPPEGILLSCPR